MNSEITAVAKDDCVGILAFSIIANCAFTVFYRHDRIFLGHSFDLQSNQYTVARRKRKTNEIKPFLF